MINKLYKAKYFPIVFQIISLIIFILLVIGGLGISTNDPVLAKQLRNTNLSNLIVWSYWWPLIIVSAVFFGRHWCTICPVELLSAITSKIGLRHKVPAFLKSGWVITILYVFIAIIAIHTLSIHRQPHRMAWYLITLMGVALIVSLLFEKRAFCSYVCPVGKLLGLYSLLAKWGIRVKSPDTCHSCKTKECIAKNRHYKLIARSCTSNLYPAKIQDNRECILCTQCIKACPHDNIKLKKVQPSVHLKLKSSEVGMITVLMGFVAYEILSSWKISKAFLLTPVKYIYATDYFSFIPESTFSAILLFLIFPLLVLMLAVLANKYSGKSEYTPSVRSIALAILPVIAFGHVFKALLKTVSRIPYWDIATEDSNGMYYASEIINKKYILPKFEMLDSLVIMLGIIILFIGLVLAMKNIWKSKNSLGSKIFISTFVIAYWLLLEYGPV